MNWVGGSRNRLVMRTDAKKQREFFEKRKIQQKLKNLGVSLAAPSPGGTGSGSMDLVTLFIVNQIAAKKQSKEPPEVAVLSSSKGRSKQKKNEPLVLPMSPCSPSQLSLAESQPQYSVQGLRKRKNVFPQGFKCRQLSPVLESAFSDNSASDYLPPITDQPSPFSSTSSACSGQEMFPLQVNLQKQSQAQLQPPPHYCSPLWDTSVLHQTKFQPFSQPRAMTDTIPWSCSSNPALFQLETPTAAQVLFGSSEPDETEARDRGRHAVVFSLNQPDEKEPPLDFTLNQSEAKQQFEEHIFRGFSYEECEGEASRFGSAKSKIYLTEETPIKCSAPQTVPECVELELSNCTDMSFSSLGHNAGPMNGCDSSPSYSCSGGYLSSDSNDDEGRCQPCLQASASYVDQVCGADTLNTNNGSQGNPKQSLSQPRPLTRQIQSKVDFRDDQKLMENITSPEKPCGSKGPNIGSSTALFLSPRTPNTKLCKCKKTSVESRDAGTQTVYGPTAETHDASTQCSFVADRENKAPGFSLYLPHVDMSEQHPPTGRRADAATEPDTLTASSEKSGSEGKQTPWSKEKSKAASLLGSSILNKFTAGNWGQGIAQRLTNPSLDAPTNGRGRENGKAGGESGQHESSPLMKDLSDEVRREVASATRGNGLLEEAKTLQEIADILLLLKQRK